MTKRFDYEIGDFVADKFGNVYKVLDIDNYERIPVKVKVVERNTETYFCGFEPASSRDEAWLFDKNFALDVVDDGKITFANDLRQISNYKLFPVKMAWFKIQAVWKLFRRPLCWINPKQWTILTNLT